MSNKNWNLNTAKEYKYDEFYTQLKDIEKELRFYKDHFKGKTVLCNCDDPFKSNFFKYFVLNFNHLGLKKLICTCYAGPPAERTQFHYDIDKHGQMSFNFDDDAVKNGNDRRHAYKAVINVLHDVTENGSIVMDDVKELFKTGENELTELEGDGDFRSEECIELLKEADIVCTNPPFSLFREYVAQLMEYKKDFLIIGSKNAITYKEIFPLMQENKIWIGYNPVKAFVKGDGTTQTFGNVCWFTNLDVKKYHEDLTCFKHYTPEEYPKYDNYDAINVDKVAYIPYDYTGIMGVPISFLDKYCPEQFEILGLDDHRVPWLGHGPLIGGKKKYRRIIIRYSDTWIISHPDNFKKDA